MTKIDKVLKKLSDLYEFNRKLKAYELKENEKADKRARPVTEKTDSR
jgi:hypothetical protein